MVASTLDLGVTRLRGVAESVWMRLIVALFLASAVPAWGEAFTMSYTETARDLDSQMREVFAANSLSGPSADHVLRTAAAWVYLGPCSGDGKKIKQPFDSIQDVSAASPSNATGAALLQAISILTREGLGRKPSDAVCRYAFETAVPTVALESPSAR